MSKIDAYKKQFLNRNLSNNNFIDAIALGITKEEFKALAKGNTELEDYLNSVLLPYLNKQDRAAWTRATSINTVAAYMEYLKRFGDNALHATEAKQSILAFEKEVWECVLNAMDEPSLADAIDNYLNHYPQGIHSDEAKVMRDDIPWVITTRLDTINAYKQYLYDHPGSPHKKEAEARIEVLVDESDWKFACGLDTRDSYKDYLEKHPNGIYRNDAMARLKRPPTPRELYLEGLLNDPNAKGCLDIQVAVDKGTVTWDEIKSIYGEEKTNEIKNFRKTIPLVGVAESKAFMGYTEVYFWGLRGTGKTCAIGATIGYLSRTPGYMVFPVPSAGSEYFSQLQALFKRPGICILPEGTPTGNLPCMPFLFKNGDGENLGDGKWRQAQIIDVAGEVFTGIYRKQKNLPLDSESHEAKAVEAMERMLMDGKNNKVHFFIFEYGDKDSLYDLGRNLIRPKHEVMRVLLDYLNEKRTLANSTYRLYALVTKSDKIAVQPIPGIPNPTDSDYRKWETLYRKWEAVRFVKDSNWKDVMDNINHLSQFLHCGYSKIPLAFSIGDVFAQNLAVFRTEDAKAVADAIAGACTPRPDPYSILGYLFDKMHK